MPRLGIIFAGVLGLSVLTAGLVLARRPEAQPAAAAPAKPVQAAAPASAAEQPHVFRVGVWQPPAGLTQVPIWPNGAPDMEDASPAPERIETAQTPEAIGGQISQAIYDVTAPTMTIYPPKGRNTGAAMVVFPGGGFSILAITIEGTEICDWLSAKGVTCILLKYRVPGSNHHWDRACRCAVTPRVPRALQDAQRTIRLVRSRARLLQVDPKKIGVIGFSAGGYLVAQTSNMTPAYKPVDAADTLSSRPDFAIALYPGHICREGGKFDPNLRVTRAAPPTFLLQAWDDPVDDVCNSTLYARALDAVGVPSEVHLFAHGGHAFGLRATPHPVGMWPKLVEAWLKDNAVL